jgi:hypothetical protein
VKKSGALVLLVDVGHLQPKIAHFRADFSIKIQIALGWDLF